MAFAGSKLSDVRFLPLMDDKGCPLDGLMSAWVGLYGTDRMRAELSMFRFNHSSQLHIQCHLQHCSNSKCIPPLCLPDSSSRQKWEPSTLPVSMTSISFTVLDPSLRFDVPLLRGCSYSSDAGLVGLVVLMLLLLSLSGVLFVLGLYQRPSLGRRWAPERPLLPPSSQASSHPPSPFPNDDFSGVLFVLGLYQRPSLGRRWAPERPLLPPSSQASSHPPSPFPNDDFSGVLFVLGLYQRPSLGRRWAPERPLLPPSSQASSHPPSPFPNDDFSGVLFVLGLYQRPSLGRRWAPERPLLPPSSQASSHPPSPFPNDDFSLRRPTTVSSSNGMFHRSLPRPVPPPRLSAEQEAQGIAPSSCRAVSPGSNSTLRSTQRQSLGTGDEEVDGCRWSDSSFSLPPPPPTEASASPASSLARFPPPPPAVVTADATLDTSFSLPPPPPTEASASPASSLDRFPPPPPAVVTADATLDTRDDSVGSVPRFRPTSIYGEANRSVRSYLASISGSFSSTIARLRGNDV